MLLVCGCWNNTIIIPYPIKTITVDLTFGFLVWSDVIFETEVFYYDQKLTNTVLYSYIYFFTKLLKHVNKYEVIIMYNHMYVDKFFLPYMMHRSYVQKQKLVKTQSFLPGKTEVLIFVTYRILHVRVVISYKDTNVKYETTTGKVIKWASG